MSLGGTSMFCSILTMKKTTTENDHYLGLYCTKLLFIRMLQKGRMRVLASPTVRCWDHAGACWLLLAQDCDKDIISLLHISLFLLERARLRRSQHFAWSSGMYLTLSLMPSLWRRRSEPPYSLAPWSCVLSACFCLPSTYQWLVWCRLDSRRDPVEVPSWYVLLNVSVCVTHKPSSFEPDSVATISL